MIRREPFGGIIYEGYTGQTFTLDQFSFRAVELSMVQNMSDHEVAHKISSEFGEDVDVGELVLFLRGIRKKFSEADLKIQKGSADDSVWSQEKEITDITHFIAPTIVFWNFTNKCNLKCIHCFQDSGPALLDELSAEECMRVIDDLHEMGVFELSFSGGEALTRLVDLMKVSEYAQSLNFRLSLATNGILATPRVSQKIYEHGFHYVQVSLEGPKELHDYIRGKGAFDQALKGARNLTQVGIPVTLTNTITNLSKDYIDYVIEMAKSIDAAGVKFVRFLPLARGLENIDKLSISVEDELRVAEHLWEQKFAQSDLDITFNKTYSAYGMKRHPELIIEDNSGWKWDCPAGRMRAAIMPEGQITTCPLVGGLERFGGNVREDSFKYLWEYSHLFQSFRKEKNDCSGCSEWKNCKGGCKAWSIALDNSLATRDPLCFKLLEEA